MTERLDSQSPADKERDFLLTPTGNPITEEEIERWRAFLLNDVATQFGYYAPAGANVLCDMAKAAIRLTARSAGTRIPEVRLGEMHESNGAVTWIVSLAKTPDAEPWNCHQVYSDTIKGRAEYEAARLKHFLGQGPEPDIMDFDTAAPVARSASGEWVACSERLPAPDVEVLVYPGWATNNGASIETYCAEYRCFLMEIEDGKRVTHWMPLPSAPRETPK